MIWMDRLETWISRMKCRMYDLIIRYGTRSLDRRSRK